MTTAEQRAALTGGQFVEHSCIVWHIVGWQVLPWRSGIAHRAPVAKPWPAQQPLYQLAAK